MTVDECTTPRGPEYNTCVGDPVSVKAVRRAQRSAMHLAKLVNDGRVGQTFVRFDAIPQGVVAGGGEEFELDEQRLLEMISEAFEKLVREGECTSEWGYRPWDYTLLLYSRLTALGDDSDSFAAYACVDAGDMGTASDIIHPSARGQLVAGPVYGLIG